MSTIYLQSIYDTALAATVRYRSYAITTTPGYTDTPASVGPYNAATHKVLSAIPADDVLWKFNGKNLFQFQSSQALPVPAINTGFATPTLTLDTTATYLTNASKLKVSALTTATAATAVWWMDAEIPPVDLTISYTISALQPSVLTEDWYAGIVFYGDTVTSTGYTHLVGYTTTQTVARTISVHTFSPASVDTFSSILSPTTTLAGTQVTADFTMNRKDSVTYTPLGAPMVVGKDLFQENAYAAVGGCAFNSASAVYGSGWGSNPARRLGICLRTTTGFAGANIDFTISDLTVRRRVA